LAPFFFKENQLPAVGDFFRKKYSELNNTSNMRSRTVYFREDLEIQAPPATSSRLARRTAKGPEEPLPPMPRCMAICLLFMALAIIFFAFHDAHPEVHPLNFYMWSEESDVYDRGAPHLVFGTVLAGFVFTYLLPRTRCSGHLIGMESALT
jgi:hypothetical protein